MKAAVITPYYKEDIAILRRCHLSVLEQEVTCRHFMVADGFPNEIVSGWDCEHIILSKPHEDYGNTARGIGALSAINQGYNPIFFLDADNWYTPQHTQKAIKLKEEMPDIDIAAAMRTLVLPDGTLVEPDQEDIQKQHVDTSCMAFFDSSFFLLAMWCTMTKPLGVIGDRIVLLAISKNQLKIGWTEERTLNYSTNYRHHCIRAGKTPPEQTYSLDTRSLQQFKPEQMWAWCRMRVDIKRR